MELNPIFINECLHVCIETWLQWHPKSIIGLTSMVTSSFSSILVPFWKQFWNHFANLGVQNGGGWVGSLQPPASGDCLLKFCLGGASATLYGMILGPCWNKSSTVLEGNQPTNQSTDQSINQSTDDPINHSANQPFSQPNKKQHTTNQPTNRPTNRSTNQSTN